MTMPQRRIQGPPSAVVQKEILKPRLWATLGDLLSYADADLPSWWRKAGLPSATLLHQAGYSAGSQLRHLVFFYRHVISNLGASTDVQGVLKTGVVLRQIILPLLNLAGNRVSNAEVQVLGFP